MSQRYCEGSGEAIANRSSVAPLELVIGEQVIWVRADNYIGVALRMRDELAVFFRCQCR